MGKRSWIILVAITLLGGCGHDSGTMPYTLFQAVEGESDAAQSPGTNDGSTVLPSPPPDFGLDGPEAFLRIAPSGLDHHGEFEIVFSRPMDTASVEAGFSMSASGGGAPLGPTPGGTFSWLNYRHVIFTPYAPIQENKTYTAHFAGGVQTLAGDPLLPDSTDLVFHTRPWVSMAHTVNSMPSGNRGIIISSAGNPPITLSSTWTNGDYITKIQLHRLDGGTIDVCTSCTSGSYSVNLKSSSLSPTFGINQYYYSVETEDGAVRNYPVAFTYGTLSSNPNALQDDGAAAFLDGTYLLPTLSRLIERFAHQDFKINNQTFNDFANGDTQTGKPGNCIDYKNFSYLRNYGNHSGQYGDGYCGYHVSDGAQLCIDFPWPVGEVCSKSDVTLDVFVTGVNIPAEADGNENIGADISIPAGTTQARVDLKGRKAYLDLKIEATLDDGLVCVGACVVSAGTEILFDAKAELNRSYANDLRTSTSFSTLSSDSSGNLKLTIANPDDPGQLSIADWNNHLDVYDLSVQDTTSWVADMLSSVVNSIGNDIVPQVQGKIVRDILKDFNERIAVQVLNAALTSLASDGVTLQLPDYLPAPLNQMDLNAKIQLSQSTNLAKSLSWKDGGLANSLKGGMYVLNGCMPCEKPSTLISPSVQGPMSFVTN
ncbi:MAG: Ig-like domain-containing protein, partial [Leptospiraceae bacterium]|nr:Ig-like domain-containing protein [Leptospiraceae bacterium]